MVRLSAFSRRAALSNFVTVVVGACPAVPSAMHAQHTFSWVLVSGGIFMYYH